MEEKEYIKIDVKPILIGLIAGVVASLWTIIPFFLNGATNLLYLTTGTGIVFLFIFLGLKDKKTLFKSGAIAIALFVIISYLIVPLGSGFILNNKIDSSQYDETNLATLTLALPGMFCSGCAFGSQTALNGIQGVINAEVSFEDKKGVIVYDPNIITPEEIVSNEIIQSYGGEILDVQ